MGKFNQLSISIEILYIFDYIMYSMRRIIFRFVLSYQLHTSTITIYSKDVRLPVQLQRAMAAEAEASREARAKVIAAEGEQKASRALREASEVIGDSPAALQLRYLQVSFHLLSILFGWNFCEINTKFSFISFYIRRSTQYQLKRIRPSYSLCPSI